MRLVGLTLLGVTLVMIVDAMGTNSTSSILPGHQPHGIIASICNNPKANNGPVEKTIIYGIESNYFVYVKPIWHKMPFDWKQAAAGYIAECKLGGSARFMDSRSGKLLATWGSNRYANYEN
jgi:hypothetical protein